MNTYQKNQQIKNELWDHMNESIDEYRNIIGSTLEDFTDEYLSQEEQELPETIRYAIWKWAKADAKSKRDILMEKYRRLSNL